MDKDDGLILACAQDRAAFQALIERHQARIYGFLIRLAGRDAADDLFQEVWMKVHANAHRYEARGKAASWLFKIANNLAMNHLARAGRRATVDVEEFAAVLAEPSPGPHAVLERKEAQRRLESMISGLPAEQRQVFLMREYGELSFKDISETLEIPLGTALSRMNYALGKLREALGDHDA